jgi:peroxiredoxin
MDAQRARKKLISGLLIWAGLIIGSIGVWQVYLRLPHAALPQVGSKAPDFELMDLSGEQVRLSDQRGRPVLINFWATWCAPCVLEMPNIQKYYERYPGEFVVLAINAGESPEVVKRFVADMGLTFDILLDPGGKIQELYRLQGYPTSFFLDAEGRIQAQHIGMLTEAQLEDNLMKVGVGE